MTTNNQQAQQAGIERLTAMLKPWMVALSNPAKAQEQVLQRLIGIFAQTEYGKQHGAEQIQSI